VSRAGRGRRTHRRLLLFSAVGTADFNGHAGRAGRSVPPGGSPADPKPAPLHGDVEGAAHRPRVRIENVADLLSRGGVPVAGGDRAQSELAPVTELAALKERIGNPVPNSVFVSSVSEGGLDPLRHALLVAARKGTEISEIRFPAGDGRMLAEIYRGATVISPPPEDGELVLSARLDKNIAGRLGRAGATVAERAAGSSSS